MLCAVIPAGTNDEALASLRRAQEAGADIAELRLDYTKDPDLPRLLGNRPLPVIVTVRPKWEGGRYEGPEPHRVGLLEDACLHGADWIDVEFQAYKDFNRRQAKLILSYHDFEGVPDGLEATLAKMRTLEPDLVKVAVRVTGTADVLRLVRLQREAPAPTVLIPMGEPGEPARILYRRFGGFMTYAALAEGEGTAPGQMTVGELTGRYRVKKIDDETRVFGVVGNPVGHSQGPRLFNRVFAELGLNACYVRLPLDDPALFRAMLDAFEVEGASVTVPHKRAALDVADEVARSIGAVNTVTRKGGKLIGTNTDAPGALDAIGGGLKGKEALVVGAGGAARALAWGLKSAGAKVTVANRTPERAEELAGALGLKSVPLADVGKLRPQVVVNATTVGMAPDVDAMPPVGDLLGPDVLVFDAVYTPRETRLLKEAHAKGARTVDGVSFFLKQAERQFGAWFGGTFPEETVREFLGTA
ncbi:MAG: type I 3-dehydroquinate dehydratase [Planctomycetota bacterium]|jgi:3-dehydroquinate dehydratase/shikimate dehydrogenase